MTINEKYIGEFKLDSYYFGGYNHISTGIKEKVLKDVKCLQFDHLYPRIISAYVDKGLHVNEPNKLLLEKFRDDVIYFVNNKQYLKLNDPSKYSECKKSINSFYGKMNLKNNSVVGFVSNYIKNYYDDFLSVNDNVIYIDTDIIFYKGEIDLLDFGAPYIVESINYAYFLKIKKYLTFSENLKSYGFPGNSMYSKEYTDAISKLRSSIRQDRIDLIIDYAEYSG